MSIYLDCNATTPLEPAVRACVLHFLEKEFGNEGSRTHEYGTAAKQAVQRARAQVASVVRAQSDEVIFTSGATESNNLALLGLQAEGLRSNRRHIVSTAIEHKAVLEPLERLKNLGFEVELIYPERTGLIRVEAITAAIRPDTLMVSLMHANNETGVIQPIEKVAEFLTDHECYFHVDAAQSFGKSIPTLRHPRIDLISVSGHKIYAPKGIGALVMRRRGYTKIPLEPLMWGGGQERGIRPGTLPVPLIAGFGLAAELAEKDHVKRAAKNARFRDDLVNGLKLLNPIINGEGVPTLPNCVSLAIPGIDSETAMIAMKGIVAASNGSACTSATYQASHVLKAMGIPEEQIFNTVRFSWCHMTPSVDWGAVREALTVLR